MWRGNTTCQPILACNTYCYDRRHLKAAVIHPRTHTHRNEERRVTARLGAATRLRSRVFTSTRWQDRGRRVEVTVGWLCVKIYDCYAAGSEWWNVIVRPLLPRGPRGDTRSSRRGLVRSFEGCRNTGLIARLIRSCSTQPAALSHSLSLSPWPRLVLSLLSLQLLPGRKKPR